MNDKEALSILEMSQSDCYLLDNQETLKSIVDIQLNNNKIINIDLILDDLMPKWSNLPQNEQISIKNMLFKWESLISNHFNRIKSKQKHMKELVINNKEKYICKGNFNFKENKCKSIKRKNDLFRVCGGSIINENRIELNDTNRNIRPRTRLLMRSFKKFDNCFNCLEDAFNLNDNYWSCLALFVQHSTKALLRLSLYIYETSKLNKCSLGSPPIFIIESDDTSNEIPKIQLQTLYEYLYLSLCQLDTYNKEERKREGIHNKNNQDIKKLNTKNKSLILILNVLIRIVQLTCLIRDNITLKQLTYDISVYSYLLEHELSLILEYLKEFYLQ
jgi:hypothetical protein